MMSKKLNFVNVSAALVVVLGMNLLVFAGDNETRLETRLTSTAEGPAKRVQPAAPALASGKAKFEMRPDRIRLSVEVEDVVASEEVEVFVNGASIGTVAIDAAGGADINLDSRDGDSVPILKAGHLVEVRATSDGALILSGMLESK